MAAAPKRAQDAKATKPRVAQSRTVGKNMASRFLNSHTSYTRCVRKCEMSKMTWQACFSDDFLANDSTNLLTLEGAIKQWYNQRTPTSPKSLSFVMLCYALFMQGFLSCSRSKNQVTIAIKVPSFVLELKFVTDSEPFEADCLLWYAKSIGNLPVKEVAFELCLRIIVSILDSYKAIRCLLAKKLQIRWYTELTPRLQVSTELQPSTHPGSQGAAGSAM